MTGISRDDNPEHPWFQELHASEMEMLDPAVRADSVRVRELLHDDFIEFGSTGRVYDKNILVEMLRTERPSTVVIRDFTVRQLASDTALVTYRTVGQSGQEARRSSVWVRQDRAWKMVFHQGTRISN